MSAPTNGRNPLALVGDKLSSLILPEALASAIGPSINGRKKDAGLTVSEAKLEKMRAELDDLLAKSCVLCELTLNQLEEPFVNAGEELDGGWTI